jgi:hypothetical protein
MDKENISFNIQKMPQSTKERKVLIFFYLKIIDTEIIINAKRVFIHPNYADKNQNDNDVAIIQLIKEVQLDQHVGVVCLPSR